MSDGWGKVVQDKGSLNRERPVTKALELPSRTGKIFIETGEDNIRLG